MTHNMHGPNIGVNLGRTVCIVAVIYYGCKLDWTGVGLMFALYGLLGVFRHDDS